MSSPYARFPPRTLDKNDQTKDGKKNQRIKVPEEESPDDYITKPSPEKKGYVAAELLSKAESTVTQPFNSISPTKRNERGGWYNSLKKTEDEDVVELQAFLDRAEAKKV